MTEHPKAKRRSVKQIISGAMYNAIFKPGLARWVMLALAAFVFMLSALYLTGSVDFREDASALVPRSADVFLETRSLKTFLANADTWQVWLPERRTTGPDVHTTHLEKAIAGLLSRRVSGLPINAPIRWMKDSEGAAFSVSTGDGTGQPSWAMYLRLDDAQAMLSDIEIEPKITLAQIRDVRGNGVYSLTGDEGGRLYVGVVAPWLILSGDEKLIEFALEAKRRPAHSLAGTSMVPRWKRGDNVRGVVSPTYASGVMNWPEASLVSGWVAPEARILFATGTGRSGGLEVTVATTTLSEHLGGGGFWPLVFVVMLVLGVLSLVVIFSLLLAIVGWGGWLKLVAAKAGIVPVSEPAAVTPSDAFRQDAGLSDAPAATAVPVVEERIDAKDEKPSSQE